MKDVEEFQIFYGIGWLTRFFFFKYNKDKNIFYMLISK